MNTVATQTNNNRYLGLLRALEGLRNGKAIALLLGADVIAVMIFFVGLSMHSVVAGMLFGLIAYIVSLVGASAAGGVLMDSARHILPRSIGDAIVVGTLDLLKILGIALIGLLGFVVYMIVLGIVLYICKIPGIGPVLYGLLLPVLVILSALVVNGLMVGLMLSNSAVWEGNSFRSALARVAAIASKRLPEVLISFLLLTLLMIIVGLIVGALMVTGYLLVVSMSASILGSSLSMSLGGLGAMGGLGELEGEGMGYLKAAGFGSGVLFAVTVTAMTSVFIMGVNLIYLSACDGLDSAAIEGAFNDRLQRVKQKADEMQQRVRERAQEAQDRARQAASAPSATAVPQTKCPACGAVVTANDAFCGECGHKF
ncbi:MAG: zinc ribbon domain-containing protein [Burkholderiales bacterium]